MKKCIKFIVYILLILIIVIFLGFLCKNENIIGFIDKFNIKMYDEPINLEDGTINNRYFNISENNENAETTTIGINNALAYCNRNNIKNVKFKTGRYMIDDSINVPSNLDIDFNSSTITLKANDKTGYSMINIENQENIRLKNGMIIGDKDLHNYVGGSTHEWGMGVFVKGSENVEIDNLVVSNMTGDGIYIIKGEKDTRNILIKNSLLYSNRRQGISIISAEKVEICYNEIYKIEGTSPQSGIDLEANKEDEKINQIFIHHNKFYNFRTKVAIMLHSNVYNVKISNNTITGNIMIYETREKAEIIENRLLDGRIDAISNAIDSDKVINELYIFNNMLHNYKILYDERVNKITIEGNYER